MVDIITNNLERIATACKEHYVQSLYLFGSAARSEDFTAQSDVDFLVSYSLPSLSNEDISFRVNNDEKLHQKLESITGRKVDLVQDKFITNRFLRYFISKDKKLLYGIS